MRPVDKHEVERLQVKLRQHTLGRLVVEGQQARVDSVITAVLPDPIGFPGVGSYAHMMCAAHREMMVLSPDPVSSVRWPGCTARAIFARALGRRPCVLNPSSLIHSWMRGGSTSNSGTDVTRVCGIARA